MPAPGYTKHGWPAVWGRWVKKELREEFGAAWGGMSDKEQKALIHARCKARLDKKKAEDPTFGVQVAKGSGGKTEVKDEDGDAVMKIGGLKFSIKTYAHGLELHVGSSVFYHADMVGIARKLKRLLVRKKIEDHPDLDNLNAFLKLSKETDEQLLAAFNGKF